MPNRIREINLYDRLQDPAEAEVWLSVVPQHVSDGTEVRGRLVGPRCAYASTVEVAYPLRPFARPIEGLPGVSRRIVIPEASLWEPSCPFLYEGPIELWENGELCERVEVRHGLRNLTLGPRGLRLSGRAIDLRGIVREECSEQEARSLHEAGINLFVSVVGNGTEALLDVADRLGFLVLLRLGEPNGVPLTQRAGTLAHQHPSALGWLVPLDWGEAQLAALRERAKHLFLGIELERLPTAPLPPQASFIACADELAPALADSPLPKLLMSPGEAPIGESDDGTSSSSLGRVHLG